MRFSIIIPYGNAEATIGACLDSVLVAAAAFDRAVENAGCEIVCVNGGSSDGTKDTVDSYADRTGLLVHLGAPPASDSGDCPRDPSGPGRARNAGLAVAKGEYVMFVDADDTVTPDALVGLKDATADIVTFLSPSGQWNLEDRASRLRLFSPMVGNLLAWNAIWRRAAIGAWRFPSLRNYEDLVWTAGMFARARTLAGGAKKWYEHRDDVAGSLVNTWSWRRVCDGWRATGMIRRACRAAHVGPATRLVLARKLAMHLLLHVAAGIPKLFQLQRRCR